MKQTPYRNDAEKRAAAKKVKQIRKDKLLSLDKTALVEYIMKTESIMCRNLRPHNKVGLILDAMDILYSLDNKTAL